MRSRKLVFFAVLVLLGILMAACASATPAAAPTAAPAPTTASVGGLPAGASLAVLLTGPWHDDSWNQAAYTAAQNLGKKGVKIAYTENVADADAARIMRQYADQGYKMIVAHSFGYQDATFQVAKDYPNVNFAWAGGIQKTGKNVADYDQPFYEGMYPIGVIAGSMTKTGVLGAMYGFDIPVCHAMGEAFLAGAKTVNPNVKLITTAVGDWVDVAKAKEAALAQADAKVDFWMQCGEGPSLGTIEAAKERSGWVTGYAGDMTPDGPNVVLLSLVWNLEPLFTQMLNDTASGKFDNPWYQQGVKQDVLQIQYNDSLKSKIPPDAIKAADQAIADIKSGKLKVPYVPQAPK